MAEVARNRIGLITYLTVPGSLAEPDAIAGLRDTLTACIGAHELRLIVDFTKVALVNSVALELLLDFQDQLSRLGGMLRIANASANVKDAMRITGVSARIELEGGVADEEEVPAPVPVPGPQSLLRGQLGEVLVARGLATEDVVVKAVAKQEQTGRRVGQILVEEGVLSEEALLQVLAEQFGLTYVRLRTGVYDPEVVRLITVETARRLRVAPLFKVRGVVFLASSDPQALPSFDAVAELSAAKVRPVLACTTAIFETVNSAYSEDHNLSDLIGELDVAGDFEVVEQRQLDDYAAIDEMASGSPVVNLLNGLIQRAVQDGASDIHIEPTRKKSRVRFRIDGLLYEVMNPRHELHPALVSRLKVMANLDIAERRFPQDGRIQVFTHGRAVDLRFSSLPGLFGEKIVLRVLDKNQAILDLNKLGMSELNLDTFKSLLERSFGLILVTGPTGSGKTTSLYAALNYLNSIEKNIVTIEDPVEYQVEIVNQNEVKDNIGLSFAKMLKHILRQDPDIVMVGEIRERETAEIAVQAALTGHLVLSTLHTNDSVGAVTRMIDMGVEPYLLSSALIGVIAQRLVRTVCPACKTIYLAPSELITRYGWDDWKGNLPLARGRGCPECYDSGYKGRIGIHEILKTDAALQRLIMSNPSRDELTDYVQKRGLQTLFDDGLLRVRQGQTTIEEVNRVVNLA